MEGPARLAMLESIRSTTSAMTTTASTSHATRSGSVTLLAASDSRCSTVTNTVLTKSIVLVNTNTVLIHQAPVRDAGGHGLRWPGFLSKVFTWGTTSTRLSPAGLRGAPVRGGTPGPGGSGGGCAGTCGSGRPTSGPGRPPPERR